MKTKPTRNIIKHQPQVTVSGSGPMDLTRISASLLLRMERKRGGTVVVTPFGYMLTMHDLYISKPGWHIEQPPAPEPFSLAVRMSHKYHTGWNGLDRWQTIGKAIVTKSGDAKWDDQGEGFKQVILVEAEAPGIRPANVKRALSDRFASGCRCEHDCCGHVQTFTHRVFHMGGDRYAVSIYGYRNI
jgi:hypothetical protein